MEAECQCVAEDVVNQVCHGDIGLRPHQTCCPDEKTVHALFLETEHMLHKAAGLGLAPVVRFLLFRQRVIAVALLADYGIHLMLCHHCFLTGISRIKIQALTLIRRVKKLFKTL